MKRLLAILLVVLSVGGLCRAEERPYDVLQRNYGPYCVPGDDLSFPMKVRGLLGGRYAFWRGSRDLYFTWCRDNAKDWLADSGAYLTNHGDLHLGNIGTYARAGGQVGSTSFGPVDFDETAQLPFQIELLQGLITLRLAARENNVELGGRREELARTLFESYRSAVASAKTTRELISDQHRVGKFIEEAQKHSYDVTLGKFTANGQFRPYVQTKKMPLKEILRPAKERTDDVARGIAQALDNSPGAKAAFRYSDVETIRRSIKDVALRTRLESVGSQGLKKYLVLLDRPLKGIDMDVVMYIKQEIPAAAERTGAIKFDPRTPGRRCSEDMNLLTNPTAYLNSWCEIGKESYWVSFKEPWSEEIELLMVRDYHDLLEIAKVWGSVAGAMHRERGHAGAILERLNKPEFFGQLAQRGTLYMAQMDRDYKDFHDDPRAQADAARAEARINAAEADQQARASLP